MKLRQFSPDGQGGLKRLLGSKAAAVTPELERAARIYRGQNAALERSVNDAIAEQLQRIGDRARELVAAVRAAPEHVRLHLDLANEAAMTVERLGNGADFAARQYKSPARRPEDEAWHDLRREVGMILHRAGIRVTGAQPESRLQPRGAILWQVLAIVSYETRGDGEERHFGRDVRDVVSWVKQHSGQQPRTEPAQTKL